MRGPGIAPTSAKVETLLAEHAGEGVEAVAVFVGVVVRENGAQTLYHASRPTGPTPELLRRWADLIEAGTAGDLRLKTQQDGDDGLEWDAKREVWVGSDGFAYDGERLFDYSRGGT